MPLPDWMAMHSHVALSGEVWPWPDPDAPPEVEPEVVREAAAFQQQHSALR